MHQISNLFLSRFGDEGPNEGRGGEDDGLVGADQEVPAVAPHHLHLDTDARPRDLVEDEGDMEADPDENPVIQLREESHEETHEARNEIYS